ncbi:hypothetical protein EV284_6155 [Streptomyces sp. BK022]|uniref:hypothetical protein n=1 Tax=Streptomyces sp. BK022 TaxID=2512123 RepID=UPI001028F0A5|nr:hypothetical protein [Streptomyces sp. BK022]RZU28820.1 hypothetical protein EV284_6155 [Streptomyces sp. BK022]
MVVASAGVALVLAWSVTVLVRRDRRRSPGSPEALRIEAAATRGLRDARRRAHAFHHFGDIDGVSALRDRD